MADPSRGGGTGVRRGRSSAGSTRTHSIRRTSLRDKMKTTKKDVAEEGLIYMKSVSQSPPPAVGGDNTATTAAEPSQNNHIITNNNNNINVNNNKEELNGVSDGGVAGTSLSSSSSPFISSQQQTDVVDLADVQISLAGSYPPTPSSAAGAAAATVPEKRSGSRPVQHVAPIVVKSTPAVNKKSSPPPPVRPARLVDRRQSSVEEATAAVWATSPNVTSNSSEPINIHVSVTINPPPVLGRAHVYYGSDSELLN